MCVELNRYRDGWLLDGLSVVTHRNCRSSADNTTALLNPRS
jgi:hypothetical protein